MSKSRHFMLRCGSPAIGAPPQPVDATPGETVSFRLREDASSCQKPTFYAAVREPAIGAKADILHLISNGPKMESGQRVERRLCEGY